MEFSIDKFNEVKRDAEKFYYSVKEVCCPYFGENIHFNAKGFEHLIFKEWNKTRVVADQFVRFRHLNLAPEIIRQSKTLQGMWTTQKFERIKKKDGWEKVMKLITYYEFIAVMESHGSKVRVKIIVKEIQGGGKFFLSIIPFWGVDRTSGKRIMHGGNPELD